MITRLIDFSTFPAKIFTLHGRPKKALRQSIILCFHTHQFAMLSVVLTPQMSHILRIWRTILIRRPKFIGKLQPRTKVLGKYSYFSVISGFHHTLWNPEKISGYTRPTLFVGLGPVWIGKRPETQKCPKNFFCDCSVKLSFWVFFSSTSKAKNNYSKYTNRICLWHQELAWEFHFRGGCSEVTKETTSFL